MSFTAARAGAQQALPPLFVAPSLAPLPPVPELRLSWPIHALQVDLWQDVIVGSADGRLQLYRLSSLWVDKPRLQLWTTNTAERALELDCRLTCQPVVNHALELEARAPLPGLGPHIPSTFVSLRASSNYNSQNASRAGLFRANFGGFLDF